MHQALTYLALFIAAVVGGAINAVAGGGTLLTFPTLVSTGIPWTMANATSTVALVPGSFSSFVAYRDEMHKDRAGMLWMGLPSLAGGIVGALLLLKMSDQEFKQLVPWLILGATVLFMLQEPIGRMMRASGSKAVPAPAGRDNEGDEEPTAEGAWPPPVAGQAAVAAPAYRDTSPAISGLVAVGVFQFFVAIYGGFFGAGMGILMLAALGILGHSNIHHMNGLKSFAAVCINGVAAVTFIVGHHVNWPFAILMAVGAIIGGYGGAGIARRIGQKNVRRLVVAIGLAITAVMFARQFGIIHN